MASCPPIRPLVLAMLLFFLCSPPCLAQSEAAPDEENCLICHRYPGLGRYDEEGNRRIYYINDQLIAHSVHGKLRCKGCHVDLDKIPHENVKKVDCATPCHVKDPSSNQEFSHQDMIEKFQQSVHGQRPDAPKRYPEDLPTCTYCHGNRTYNPYAGIWGKSEALSLETLVRCQGCHKDKAWTQRLYAHFTHRMRRRRSQYEIIRLCTSCHEDENKMVRHGLEAVSTFRDTFHWTLVKYGVQNAPDCLTCHVPVGYATHVIRPRTDPVSPIAKTNRIKTCSNQGGILACHPGATARFAEGRVHSYGTKVQLLTAREAVRVQVRKENPLLLERAGKEVSARELFHYRVLNLIRLAYKILIAMVIGFMFFHQSLDFVRTKWKMRKAHKKLLEKNTRYFIRMNTNEKVQHFIFVVCFFMLAFTGLMVWLPEKTFDFLGGAKASVFLVRSVVHRIFGTLMILVCVYHVCYLFFKPAGRRWFVDMIPGPKDIGGFFSYMLYLIGIRSAPPEFDRFCYKHKMEYGALIVGTTLMSVTGLLLWSEQLWDKFFIDIATLVHSMEAILACLAVMIWHLYEVHLRPHKFPIDNMWLTGIIDEEEMREEYPLHYRKIMDDPELQAIYMREGSEANE